MLKNMCDHRALQSFLKQCISDKCSTRKCAAQELLFELPRYDPLLSQNGGAKGRKMVRGGKR